LSGYYSQSLDVLGVCLDSLVENASLPCDVMFSIMAAVRKRGSS